MDGLLTKSGRSRGKVDGLLAKNGRSLRKWTVRQKVEGPLESEVEVKVDGPGGKVDGPTGLKWTVQNDIK